ncbi:RHS repeat-associated core domain-containing protein [Lacinutrix sp.]|uniref:RHS repeat-associated core domain-containing protein n=1 Tax=Lacinutrix sp. TaxID=1937692 RepID=UPI0025C04AB8|nr:RHS repeat-associated core domain-containing protein [Lacinutrix sp.]
MGKSSKKRIDYYPFGMPMPDRNVEGDYRYGYQGEYAEKDKETGLNAFQLRMYDSRIGRWISPDPMGEFFSPYLAMGNNPISKTDPTGGSTSDCPKCPDPNGPFILTDGMEHVSSDGQTYSYDKENGWSSAPIVDLGTTYKTNPRINIGLSIMKNLVDENIKYSQAGNRTSLTGNGLCGLDCSETVAIYLKMMGTMQKRDGYLYTGVMTNEKDFRNAIGSNNIDFVEGSTASDFTPRAGDIFVWRKSNGVGHTGIIYSVDGNKATVLEAIGNVGSSDERFNRNNGGSLSTGISRTAVYRINGRALSKHAGWYGYFRPINVNF